MSSPISVSKITSEGTVWDKAGPEKPIASNSNVKKRNVLRMAIMLLPALNALRRSILAQSLSWTVDHDSPPTPASSQAAPVRNKLTARQPAPPSLKLQERFPPATPTTPHSTCPGPA